MTFNTGNPIGSTDARDRSDNSENLDLAVNSLSQTFVDRLGVTRDTLEGIYQKSAYYRAGTFDAGYTLTNNRQTLAYGNVEYSWSGAFPKVVAAGSTPVTAGGVGVGLWTDKTDLMLRSDLVSSGKDALVGHVAGSSELTRTVKNKLDQFSSVEDYNSTKNEFGNNATADAAVINDVVNADEDFLLPRNLSVAKDLYGVRRNACVQSIRANAGNDGFNAQVTGVSSTQELANYGHVDNVSLIADITNKPYSAWEIVSAPTYSITGFSATGLDFTKMKKGMIVQTLHASHYFGIISSLSAKTNTVNVIEWRKLGSTSAETPPNGYGLVINPVGKIWAANFNIYLPLGSRCENAAVAEYGLINNNNPNPTSMNMMDLVILEPSTYGATSAVFAHSSAAAKFYAPFIARNSTHAAFLADEDNQCGFLAKDATLGFVYYADVEDGSKYSYSVKSNNNEASTGLRMAIDDSGRACRMPEKVGVVLNGVPLSFSAKRWINTTHSSVTTALPADSIIQDGDLLKLHCTTPASGLWTVTAGSILPPSGAAIASSCVLIEGVYDAVYIQGVWYITK